MDKLKKGVAIGIFLGGIFLIPISQSWAAYNASNFESAAQSHINDVGEWVVNASAHRAVAPASALGIIGFDIGLTVGLVPFSDAQKNSFRAFGVSSSDTPSAIPIPRLSAIKGLPWEIDVGASLMKFRDVTLLGAHVQKEIIDLGIVTLAGRFNYSKAEFYFVEAQSYGLDFLVSSQLLLIEPYAAISYLKGKADFNPPSDLNKVAGLDYRPKTSDTNLIAGIKFNLAIFKLSGEIQVGQQTLYAAKFSAGF